MKMNPFRTVCVNFVEPFFILIKPILLKQQIWSNLLLFGYDHPFSQQSRITLHSRVVQKKIFSDMFFTKGLKWCVLVQK